MKAILRSINNFSCKLKQSNNLKYNISPKIRSNKFKSISGNGNVTIEDALNKNLKDYKIYGNTYQNSTSGKNLLGFGTTNTGKGTQTTYDKKTGLMTTVGTTLQGWPWVNEFNVNIPVGTTLTISSNSQYQIYARLYYNDSEYYNIDNKTTKTRTLTRDIKKIVLLINAPANTIIDETYYVQIEEGSTATEFEPYTGGQPSPNPDYPQEIISCGDRTKNLFDKNNANIINGYIQGSTGKIISGDGDLIAYIKCKPNTQYSFQRMQIRDNKGRFRIGTTQTIPIANMTVENFYYKYSSEYNTTKLDGYVTNANAKYLLFYFSQISGMSQDEIDTILGSIQIEENPIATEYETYYNGYKIPVNVRSDNLFDKDNANLVHLYTDGTVIKNSAGANTYYIKCKSNTTYTIIKSNTGTNNRFCVFTCDDIPTAGIQILNYIGTSAGADNSVKYTINTPNTAKYLCVFVGVASTTPSVNEISNSIQIVEGSTAPSKYISYYNETTNIYLDEPLRKIDEYSDYIDFINGKIVRQLGEVVFDGSENWVLADIYNNISQFDCSNNLIKIFTQYNNISLFANYFGTTARWNKSWLKDNIALHRVNNHKIRIQSSNFTTLEDFKEWLSSNPVTVDYVLATPTEEDIELPNINLIEGKNIITIGTEVYGVFEVEYCSKEIIDISDYKYNLRKVED